MSGWEAVHVDDLDAVPIADGVVWRPVRSRFGIRAFGVNAYSSDGAGQLVVEDHDESGGGAGGHEELYVVLRGRARFTIDGEALEAPAGTLVFIRDPAVRRAATAEEADTIVLAIGGEPGRAFEISPWESIFAALPDMRAERWDDAIARIEAGLRDRPGHPALLYNLACAESRAGQHRDALDHLRSAVADDPSFFEAALTDSDLDPIRDSPDFPARA